MTPPRRTRAGEKVAELWERAIHHHPVTLPFYLPDDHTQADYDRLNALFRWLHKHKWEERKVGLNRSTTYYYPGTAPFEGGGASLASLKVRGLENWPLSHR